MSDSSAAGKSNDTEICKLVRKCQHSLTSSLKLTFPSAEITAQMLVAYAEVVCCASELIPNVEMSQLQLYSARPLTPPRLDKVKLCAML